MRCAICGEVYEGYGHDAEPITSERACEDCNEVVLAERLRGAVANPVQMAHAIVELIRRVDVINELDRQLQR